MKDQKKFLLEQARLINDTAFEVYGAIQGGVKQNFFAINSEYEAGRYGWIKENTSFEASIGIYELYTSNYGWDIVKDIRDEFPDIDTMSYEEFKNLTNED